MWCSKTECPFKSGVWGYGSYFCDIDGQHMYIIKNRDIIYGRSLKGDTRKTDWIVNIDPYDC